MSQTGLSSKLSGHRADRQPRSLRRPPRRTSIIRYLYRWKVADSRRPSCFERDNQGRQQASNDLCSKQQLPEVVNLTKPAASRARMQRKGLFNIAASVRRSPLQRNFCLLKIGRNNGFSRWLPQRPANPSSRTRAPIRKTVRPAHTNPIKRPAATIPTQSKIEAKPESFAFRGKSALSSQFATSR